MSIYARSHEGNHRVLAGKDEYSARLDNESRGLSADEWNPLFPGSATIWLIGLYIGLIIIRPWEILLPWLADYSPERLVVGVTFLTAVLENRLFPRMRLPTIAVLGFLAALAGSGLLGVDLEASWQEWYKYFAIVAIHLIIICAVRTRREVMFILGAYLLALLFYFGKAEWEYYVHGRYAFRQGVRRMGGLETTFGTANMFAASAVVSLPFWFLFHRVRHLILGSASVATRKLASCCLWAYLPVAAVAIYESKSRTGIAAAVVAIFLIVNQLGSARAKFLVCAVVAIFGVLAVTRMEGRNLERIESIWNSEAGPAIAQESTQGRIQGLKMGVEMFFDRPFSGVGLGNFISVRQSELDGVEANPHNLLGLLLGETGLIGTLAFGGLLITTLLACRRIRRHVVHSADSDAIVFDGVAVAIRDAFLLLLICGVTGHNLFRFQWYLLPALAGITLSLVETRSEALAEINQHFQRGTGESEDTCTNDEH